MRLLGSHMDTKMRAGRPTSLTSHRPWMEGGEGGRVVGKVMMVYERRSPSLLTFLIFIV